MEAIQHQMGELFTRETFRLFKAQRPYVWDEELALKLLEDFLSQVGDTGDAKNVRWDLAPSREPGVVYKVHRLWQEPWKAVQPHQGITGHSCKKK